MTIFSATWNALAAEAGVAAAQLGMGATALGRTSPHEPWTYPQAFFPLTIGMERAAKLALQVDARLRTGAFLTEKEMRAHGHRLGGLLRAVEEMAERRWPGSPRYARPSGPFHEAILTILEDFATGGRYHNLDSLAGVTGRIDPAAAWWDNVVLPIAAAHVGDRGVPPRSPLPAGIEQYVSVRHRHVDGSVARSLGELVSEQGRNERAVPWVRQYVLQEVRWLATVLGGLGTAAHYPPGCADIPEFSEFFTYFTQADDKLRARKTWPTP